MATTDFVQHNPTAANQQPNSTFAGDSLTTSGIGTDAIMPSDWMNARWYQDSTFVTAFCLMLAAKGISTSAANISTLASVLATIQTANDVKPAQITVAFSATPIFDASAANGFAIHLTGNVTSSTLPNSTPGQIITFYITSASPGALTFAWPANVSQPPNVQLESSGAVLTYQFVSDGTNLYPLPTFLTVIRNALNALTTSVNSLIATSPVLVATGSVFIPATHFGAGNEQAEFSFTIPAVASTASVSGSTDVDPGLPFTLVPRVVGSTLYIKLLNNSGGGTGGAGTSNDCNFNYRILQ